MTETDLTYGPIRPPQPTDYTNNRKESYVQGHALKIVHDLEKMARIYSGHKARIYREAEGVRCTRCTDQITGAVMITNCPECGGSSREEGFVVINESWVQIEVPRKHKLTGQMGNSDSPGGATTPIVLINTPLLKDQDLIITLRTKEIYKIVDVAPQIVAFQGYVITQLAQCYNLSRGSREYNLIDW